MTGIPRIERRLDRAAFFDDLGYEPHQGQWQIHRSRAPRRVVACGVRWGKTVCAAMEGLAAAMEPADRSVGWVCAPTYDLADRVFRELQLTSMESRSGPMPSCPPMSTWWWCPVQETPWGTPFGRPIPHGPEYAIVS